MQLAGIRKRIERDIRHAPGVEAHREEILDRVNDKLQEVVLAEDWSFRRRIQLLRLKADVEVAPADYVAAAFNIATDLPTGWDATDVELLPGAALSFVAPTALGLTADYIIERATLAGITLTMYLDPRYTGAGSLAGSEDVFIRHRRYLLPVDCANVDVLVLRETEEGYIEETPLSEEARLLLQDDDDPGRPRTYTIAPNLPGAVPLRSGSYYPHDIAHPPFEAPAIASGLGGLLTPGDTYEYRYAWQWGGLVSEPSPAARVTIEPGDSAVTLSALEVVAVGYGRRKQVFRRRIYADHEGAWITVGFTDGDGLTFTDAGTVVWPGANPTTVTRERTYHPGGLPKSIRIWPPTDADMEVELHYHSKVPRLEAESDVPEMPEEAHMLLVHHVVRELAGGAEGKQVQKLAEAKIVELMGVLTRTYLGHRGARFQRKPILRSGGQGDILVGPLNYLG
jgi:hypothetical protein